MPEEQITPEQLSYAMLQYFRDYKDQLRFGQFFCNRFSIQDTVLFYEMDFKTALTYIVEHYILDEY